MEYDIIGDIASVEATPPAPTQTSASSGGQGNSFKKPFVRKDKINMYDVEFIKSLPIDTDGFTKVGKTFAVNACGEDGEEEYEKAKVLILKICTRLASLGYVYRVCFGERDKLEKQICEIEGLKTEIYLPYKKFNVDYSENAIISNYFEKPFRYAAEIYGKKFNENLATKKGMRGIYASRLQSMLGKTCDNPVNFVIIWSKSGRDYMPDRTNTSYGSKPEKVDYDGLGNTPWYMKVAQASGITVYNVKKQESVLTLKNSHLTPKDDEKSE